MKPPFEPLNTAFADFLLPNLKIRTMVHFKRSICVFQAFRTVKKLKLRGSETTLYFVVTWQNSVHEILKDIQILILVSVDTLYILSLRQASLKYATLILRSAHFRLH